MVFLSLLFFGLGCFLGGIKSRCVFILSQVSEGAYLEIWNSPDLKTKNYTLVGILFWIVASFLCVVKIGIIQLLICCLMYTAAPFFVSVAMAKHALRLFRLTRVLSIIFNIIAIFCFLMV